MQLPPLLKLTLISGLAVLVVGCAAQPAKKISRNSLSPTGRLAKVRTTAYTHSETGGHRNAIGTRLSGTRVMSAASDWSRYPLGTRFRIAGTEDEFMIDDYGGALVGTNTIDLYKPTRLKMRQWGVRHVDIDIVQWGSDERSLAVLAPRSRNHRVQRMIAELQRKKRTLSTLTSF